MGQCSRTIGQCHQSNRRKRRRFTTQVCQKYKFIVRLSASEFKWSHLSLYLFVCHCSHLNLCGSSVSSEAVKEILGNCRYLNSINLSSCRGLPRGVKRLMQGTVEICELRETLGVKLKHHPNDNNRSESSLQHSNTPNTDDADK